MEKSNAIYTFLYDSIYMSKAEIETRVKELRAVMPYEEMSQLVIKTAKQELIGLSMDSGGWYLREGCITSAIAELKRE